MFGARAQFASPPPLIRPLFLPRFLQWAAADQRGRTEACRAVRAWIDNLPTIAAQNEIQIEADFYNGFLKPLGYPRPEPDRSEWTLQPKYTILGDGIVDAALGTFRADASGNAIQGEPQVVVELERPGKKLDVRDSRGESPVQQVWRDLNESETARWGLLSDGFEIRLYHKLRTPKHMHRVVIADLADPDEFNEFHAVFHPGGCWVRREPSGSPRRFLKKPPTLRRRLATVSTTNTPRDGRS